MKKTLFALSTILLLAGFLRFWQLNTLPLGFYHDEAYYGLDALSLNEGALFPQYYEAWEHYANDAHAGRPAVPTQFPIFFEGNYGREPVHIYLVALSISFFGNTPWAVRVVPATAGVLAVLTTFIATYQLTLSLQATSHAPHAPATTALFSALALAILFPALHFSRFGLRCMVFVPVEMLCITFFWRGITQKSTASFILSGLLLGLGLYIYAAGRILPLLFVLFIPLWFLSDRQAMRQFWWVISLMAGVALLVAAPMLYYFYRYPYFFFFRTAYVANRGVGAVEGQPLLTWVYNIGRVLRGLVWLGETHFRHNLPGRPFMDAIQTLFFGFGWFSLTPLRRHPVSLFILLWFLTMLLPSIMSGDAPHFGRLTGVMPVVAVLIGFGAEWLWRKWANPLAHPAVLVLFALSTIWTSYDYFVRYAQHPLMLVDFYQPDWTAGQYMADLPAGTTLYMTPTQEEMATIFYALGSPHPTLRSFAPSPTLLPAGQEGQPAAYLVRHGPEAQATLATLQTYFPAGQREPALAGYTPFLVPASAPRYDNNLRFASASFADKITLVGYTSQQNESNLEVTLVWQALAEVEIGLTAFVHLLDKNGQILAQSDRPPAGYPTSDWRPGEIVVDTFTILLPDQLPSPIQLRTGFYDPAGVVPLGEPVILE